MSIRVQNLTKIYGQQKAVDDISFEIPQGSIVGFLGPNGAGKSTTMKILTGFIPPTSGNAFIEGMDVESESLKTRRITGYLPEHNPLYLDMYVKEYLVFMAELNQVKRAFNRADDIIELTGLTLEKKKKIGALSKGYRQRVGIAQALIHDPKVLILDEPTSGFDPNQLGVIRSLIKEIGKEKTVLLSTHIMQEVEAICERIIIIDKGKIVADANTTSLHEFNSAGVNVFVEFSDPLDLQFLNLFDFIIHVKNGHKPNSYIIQTSDSQRCKIELNKVAASQQRYILEQREEKENLENIFQKLTQ
jgi:ABC-2 type transport system ATP-binding protein